MKRDIKISIITATYNAEKTLEKSILSILNQSYKNIEYILIDGGSTDFTLEIIQEHKGKIDYYLSEPDKGIYDAWNKGLDNASGDWIVFIGADDFLLEDAISSYVKMISENVDLDMITSKAIICNENGLSNKIIGKPFSSNKLRHHMHIVHSGCITKKSIFDKYGPFDLKSGIVGDYEYLLRVYKFVSIGFLDKVTLHFSSGGLSSRNIIPILDTLAVKNRYFSGKIINYLDFFIAILKFKLRIILIK
jgi:glycosyltransferase involved in cell wall biosynthesis